MGLDHPSITCVARAPATHPGQFGSKGERRALQLDSAPPTRYTPLHQRPSAAPHERGSKQTNAPRKQDDNHVCTCTWMTQFVSFPLARLIAFAVTYRCLPPCQPTCCRSFATEASNAAFTTKQSCMLRWHQHHSVNTACACEPG